MPLIRDEDKETIRKEFAEHLVGPVRLVMFTQEFECQFCAETRQIVEELAALSDKVTAEIYDFVADKDKAEEYGIDKIPAIAIIGEKDYGIRFYGIPSGYEFTSLFEDIIDVSRGESALLEPTKKALAQLKAPVHIQVFVTPTCPYCPMAVRLAHRLAMESDLVRADMVEAMEFPQLAIKYQVQGVPRSVINETIHQEGAAPEPLFMMNMMQGLGLPLPEYDLEHEHH
ncbi:MAG: thioredoxin family protein [Anaerolineae bacterium]|jgi:glutaredoxin-like protein|nr:thioredoxin family protein [Anaerolineae bacterium]MDH7473021.1 thioredoxin family protein [Anaerolineae bacterium]